MLWFISASFVSLLLGCLLVNLFQPGTMMHLELPPVDASTGIDKAAMTFKGVITHIFPKSVIEAMAAGLPVIVSDGVGAATFIDEHSGFILPIEQDQWIKAILALYFNPSLRINMGLQASDKVASLTWENYQNDLKLCLNEVI